MAKAIDGSIVPDQMTLPVCKNIAYFDQDSGCSYRCSACNAVWTSVATPDRCNPTTSEGAENEK